MEVEMRFTGRRYRKGLLMSSPMASGPKLGFLMGRGVRYSAVGVSM